MIRRLLLSILIVCCFASLAFADAGLMGEESQTPATSATGNELNETWQGATAISGSGSGSADNAWTGTVSTGSINLDATLTGTPASGYSTGALLSRPTGDTLRNYATWNRGSAITTGTAHTVEAQFRINSYDLPNTNDRIHVMQWGDQASAGSSDEVFSLQLLYNGTGLQLQTYGATTVDGGDITLGTWHTVTVTVAAVAANSTVQVDSQSAVTFTAGAFSGQYLNLGPGHGMATDESIAVEFSNVTINTP